MSQDTSTGHGVRAVTVPPAARAISTLSHVDYEDAFVIDLGPAQDRTAEQWARAILEDTSPAMRRLLATAWFALRLDLGPTPSDQFVLGLKIQSRTPDRVLSASALASGCAESCCSTASSRRSSTPRSSNRRVASRKQSGQP